MASPQKAKGDEAERQAARLITDLTGWSVRRMLGAGRKDDVGDLDGVPDTVIQVSNRQARFYESIREKPLEAELQRVNAGALYAATFVRLRGGEWRVVMTPEQWATYAREAC